MPNIEITKFSNLRLARGTHAVFAEHSIQILSGFGLLASGLALASVQGHFGNNWYPHIHIRLIGFGYHMYLRAYTYSYLATYQIHHQYHHS
jgi:hypothetical protein